MDYKELEKLSTEELDAMLHEYLCAERWKGNERMLLEIANIIERRESEQEWEIPPGIWQAWERYKQNTNTEEW